MAKEDIKIKGNYDDESERMLMELKAACVTLIVIGGSKGNGFSVSGLHEINHPDNVIPKLPGLLRDMADSIEADIKLRKLQ